ncbi:MAG: hypothetical protein MZU91_10270 [Desulfosudis oleivorans]|nr:hypothetical protein [Desulfosudis oleivorans]
MRDTIDGSVRAELPLAGRFSADGSRFLGTDGTLVRMWELRGGQESVRLTARKPPAGVLDAPGGRYLALIAEDHSVELWDTGHPRELSRIAGVRAGRLERPGTLRQRHRSGRNPAGGCRRRPCRCPAAAGRVRTSTWWPVRTAPGRSGLSLRPERSFWQARLLRDGGLIDPGGEGRTLWEGESAVRAAFSADGSLVAGAHADGTLRALRTADGSQVWQVALGKTASATAVVARRTYGPGRACPGVRTARAKRSVLDAVTGSVKLRLPGAAATALSLDPTGQRLAVAESARVTVFDVARRRQAGRGCPPPSLGHVGAVVLQPDGQRLATLAGSRASTFLGGVVLHRAGRFRLGSGRPGGCSARIPPGQDRAADYPETLKEEEKAYLNGAMLSADGRAVAGTDVSEPARVLDRTGRPRGEGCGGLGPDGSAAARDSAHSRDGGGRHIRAGRSGPAGRWQHAAGVVARPRGPGPGGLRTAVARPRCGGVEGLFRRRALSRDLRQDGAVLRRGCCRRAASCHWNRRACTGLGEWHHNHRRREGGNWRIVSRTPRHRPHRL